MSSHWKGTAPQKQTKTPIRLSQQITRCEWNSGTLSQHVAWLCDSRFLSQGVLYPKRGQAVLKRILKHFAYCPGDSTRSVQWVMIQDKPGRVLRSFVVHHSWTPFNQRPSDTRNCFRATLEFFSAATKYALAEDEHCTPSGKVGQFFSVSSQNSH